MSAPLRVRADSRTATEGLWSLAEFGDVSQLEYLVASGADVNSSNCDGVTPLMRAAYHGRDEVVRALIKHGADLNATRGDGFTPLLLAAFFGHDDVVRTLVELGADLSSTTRFGTSAQMWATARSFYEIADYLKEVSVSSLPAAAAAAREDDQDPPVSTQELRSPERTVKPAIQTPVFLNQAISEHIEDDVVWPGESAPVRRAEHPADDGFGNDIVLLSEQRGDEGFWLGAESMEQPATSQTLDEPDTVPQLSNPVASFEIEGHPAKNKTEDEVAWLGRQSVADEKFLNEHEFETAAALFDHQLPEAEEHWPERERAEDAVGFYEQLAGTEQQVSDEPVKIESGRLSEELVVESEKAWPEDEPWRANVALNDEQPLVEAKLTLDEAAGDEASWFNAQPLVDSVASSTESEAGANVVWHSEHALVESKETANDDEDEKTLIAHPVQRTLKDPPEIWDLVHENRTEFKPSGAFITRITSGAGPLLLLVLVVILISGAGTLAFLKLRGSSSNGATAKVARDNASAQVSAPASADNSLSGPTTSPQPIDSPIEKAATEQATSETKQQPNETQAERVSNSSVSTSSAPLAVAPVGSKTKAEPRSETRVASRTAAADSATSPVVSTPKPQTPDAVTTRPVSDGARDTATPKQTANTTQSPASPAPATAAGTAKPKVIQWP